MLSQSTLTMAYFIVVKTLEIILKHNDNTEGLEMEILNLIGKEYCRLVQ